MDTITYDDFLKVELVVGEITKVEAVPKSEKLLKLEVFFGAALGHRTIMAGIASMLSFPPPAEAEPLLPESLVGRQCVRF